jgi:hypothetical protein
MKNHIQKSTSIKSTRYYRMWKVEKWGCMQLKNKKIIVLKSLSDNLVNQVEYV